MKTVYIAMSTDIIHHGHMNVIEEGRKHGKIIIGLLTDEAIASYKRIPLLKYEQRKIVFENIQGVDKVIAQDDIYYTENLKQIKPDIVIHGDDWVSGVQQNVRKDVIEVLKAWGGQLVEVPYTEGVSGSEIELAFRKMGTTPGKRRKLLRELLALKNPIRVMEAHSGLTGLIVENARVEEGEEIREFDAMWISSLCDSTIKGKPDIELVDLSSRLNTINEIMEVTSKPIILDGDTGGLIEHFVYTVKTLERLGVSAIIIEDKVGLKKNSLFGTDAQQSQDEPVNFAEKIKAGKLAQVTKEFMVIARIESLILKQGEDDAINRAKVYVKAGADAIMIHSKDKDGTEIMSFLKRYKEEVSNPVPVVLVPTSYNQFTEEELAEAGGNIIIYANHFIRSAYPAMAKTAETILKNKRSLELGDTVMSIKEILNLIPGGQ